MLAPGTSESGLCGLIYPMQDHSIFVTDYHKNNSPKGFYMQYENSNFLLYWFSSRITPALRIF